MLQKLCVFLTKDYIPPSLFLSLFFYYDLFSPHFLIAPVLVSGPLFWSLIL